jgi:hypothetical protein
MVLSTTVKTKKDDEDYAIETAKEFIKDYHGLDLENFRWNAIDVVVLESA